MPEYQSTLKKLLERLRESDEYIICTHRSPDPDGLGSSIGLSFLLQSLGKKHLILNHDGLPERIRFLDPSSQVRSFEENGPGAAADYVSPAVISVDNSETHRLGDVNRFIREDQSNLFIIDHHDDASPDFHNRFQYSDVAATSEVIFDLLEVSGLFSMASLPLPVASALYAGVASDTGNFRFRKTTARSHEIAAFLLKCGVRPEVISERLQFHAPVNKLHLRRAFYQSLIVEEKYGFAWAVILESEIRSLGLTWDDLDGMINELIEPAQIHAGILITERGPQKTKVSLRAKSGYNVLPVAEKYGGGGHTTACGVTLSEPYLQVTEKIIRDLKEYFGKNS